MTLKKITDSLGFIVLAAGVPALAVWATLAQAASFADIDTDADGMISEAEFATAYPQVDATVFVAADGDGDGLLSEAEHAAAVDAGVLNQDG